MAATAGSWPGEVRVAPKNPISRAPSATFALRGRPADDSTALVVYSGIVDDLVRGYALSRDPTAIRYRSWRRYNRPPDRSATQGERYVNATAKD